jgi:LemA protein
MATKRDYMDEMENLGMEATNSERMQRMRRLMHQLYHEHHVENDPQELPTGSVPAFTPIRSRMLVLWISLISVVIVLSTTLYNFNRFVVAEEMVLSAKGFIENALQLRSNLFINLVNLTMNQAVVEHETIRYVVDTRSGAGQKPAPVVPQGGAAAPLDPAMFKDGLSPASLSRLMAVVEQYPDIKTAIVYQGLMDKLMELEKNIHQRRDEYNEKVRAYNTLITTFPWRILATALGFRDYRYFESDPHKPDTEELFLNSGTFRRLLPRFGVPAAAAPVPVAAPAPVVPDAPVALPPHPASDQHHGAVDSTRYSSTAHGNGFLLSGTPAVPPVPPARNPDAQTGETPAAGSVTSPEPVVPTEAKPEPPVVPSDLPPTTQEAGTGQP